MTDEENKSYSFDSNAESSSASDSNSEESQSEDAQSQDKINNDIEEIANDSESGDSTAIKDTEAKDSGTEDTDAEDTSEDSDTEDKENKEEEKDTWDPILLEGEGVTECPNCGAPMPDKEEVLCLRCGFDLSRMQKVSTETGDEEVEPTDEEEAAQKPELSPAGQGGIYLPAIIAGVCVLIMAIAFLAGASGLYPTVSGMFLSETHTSPVDVETDFTLEHPGFLVSVFALAKYCVFAVIMTACALTALFVVARLERRRLGDFNLLLVRCLAIISACLVIRLIGFSYSWSLVEQILQLILMCGIFFGLAKVFFRTDTRQTILFGGVTMIALVLLFAVSGILVWSLP